MSYFRIGDGMVRDAETGEAHRWDAAFPEHYGASALRARGWSDAMIRDLLGGPCITVTNPYFTKASRARLWSRSQVEQAETGPEFRERVAARKTA